MPADSTEARRDGVNYTYSLAMVAFVALVFYDHLLTFDKEVACIWRRKINVPSVLCLLNRYLLLCVAIFAGLEVAPWSNVSAQSCRINQYMIYALSYVLVGLFQWFSLLRIYAILQRRLVPVVIIVVVNTTSAILGALLYSSALGGPNSTPPSQGTNAAHFGQCVDMVLDRGDDSRIYMLVLGIISQICVVLEGIVTVAFTLNKTFGIRREAVAIGMEVPPLSALLLRDGSLEFLALLLLNVSNIIQTSFTGSSSVVISFVNVLAQAIMFSHFFFHLRQVHLRDGANQSTSSLISIQFASVVVGNLGAPLDNSFYPNSDDDNDDEEQNIQFSRDPLAAGLMRDASEEHSSNNVHEMARSVVV
ncbi:hypothetical protein K474DRAFT_1668970 [Panus rudis PR-1116 ss-1]|nr:hypothetical protein K474DRAFT_1668970 [Panus rudis PR-1116 ss-1]